MVKIALGVVAGLAAATVGGVWALIVTWSRWDWDGDGDGDGPGYP
jgi:hypothetical protein